MRVELFVSGGPSLYDSGWMKGNVLDWPVTDGQGNPLASGSYRCVVTAKDLAGGEMQKAALITVGGVEPSAPPSRGQAAAIATPDADVRATVVVHDGETGAVVATRGGLTFRTGDVFAGTEKEGLRLTPEGKVGIGTTEPQ